MAAATEEKKKLEPKAEIAEVGPCKLKLKIEVSAAKVHERVEDEYKKLAQTAELPGFRKGHAPRPILERKFGKALLEDLKFDVLTGSFEEVKEEKHLEPLGEPEIDVEKVELKDNAPFTYEVTIEVKPKIEVKNFTGLKVKKVEADVTDADVETHLKDLREEHAELVPADDAAAEGDQVIGDFELVTDAGVKDKAENVALFLNDKISFHGVELPDFHKALAGRKAGDAVEYPLMLADDYADKSLAGKKAKLSAKIKAVKRRRLPELDAAFAKTFDMDSIDELKDDLRKHLKREKEREAAAAQSRQILDQILKENDFPLPEGLIAASTKEAEERARTELLMRGAAEDQVEDAVSKHQAESRESMIRHLRERFVLEEIARKEKIFVTEDDVDARLQAMAGQAGRHPHEIRSMLEEREMMSSLRRSMREEKVREFLLSKAVIE
ncbi:MAG TPA: trigger factor [Planctomycetota bacterium]|nr:trigger factor [Planctomycetota bacterium]